MFWETMRAIYPFDLFMVVVMAWASFQVSRLFPALRYWLAMHVTYIIPPLEEDTAHLLDRPTKGKSEPVKPKDSMVVRYGKITAFELTRVVHGTMFGNVLASEYMSIYGVAFVWVLHQLPEPATLLHSEVTPVLLCAALTCCYVAVTISLLGDSTASYKWQLSAIFGIVFACLSFAFLLENTDELLDIPLYQGLDAELTRRFNLPLWPSEDDDDDTAFDRRQLVARVILALGTGLLAFCHFSQSVRRAVYHHRLVHSQFHGPFFKVLEYLYLALLPLLVLLWFRAPTEFALERLHLDQTVGDTCQRWLGASTVCGAVQWTGVGARDWYHALRWAVHGGVVALALLLFRPLLSAHTQRVAAVMKGLLALQPVYGGEVVALMLQEARTAVTSLGTVCTELSALPLLLLTWQWHYHAHWLVDYLALVSLLAHGTALLLAFATIHLGADTHRPAFFDTVLRWWDRRSATTPRNNAKKLRATKKKTAEGVTKFSK